MNRAPGMSWHLREGPFGWVRTTDNDRIEIVVPWEPGITETGARIEITRRDARLLAKRITQCLDQTARP